MNIKDLLESEITELPKDRTKSKDDYYGYLKGVFDDYNDAIKSLNNNDVNSKNVKSQIQVLNSECEKLLKIIELSYSGLIWKSSTIFNELMEDIRDWMQKLLSKDISKSLNYLYRARIGENQRFDRKDIFHIPFEMREKVADYRYSMGGVPSLYLSGSVYTCWEELGRPDVNQMQLSRFSVLRDDDENIPIDRKVKVLNFGLRPKHVSTFAEQIKQKEFVTAYILCWPLIAACSIKVKNPDSPFKPEYIISQLLLEWLSVNSIYDGIRYFSTKIELNPEIPNFSCNFVFPSKTFSLSGFCPILNEKFYLTAPVSWQLANNTNAPTHPKKYPNLSASIRLSEDTLVNYANSTFEKIERKLGSLPLESVI